MSKKPPQYELNQRQEIYKGRIVNLLVDHITTDGGFETIREVFHHPGGAAVIPMLANGNVLLVEQFRYPMQEFVLELPAGKIDPGENPETTAARELEEEVGYRAGKLKKIAEFYTTPGFCDERLTIFLATELTPTQTAHDTDEDLTIHSYSVADLKELVRNQKIVDAKTLIGIQYLLLEDL